MRVTIEKLVYGGSGLARTPDGVVFVPRTAVGDVLEVEIIETKKDYAVARMLSLIEPSPDRQEPYCPNYETAGCCHWQHIRYEKQTEYKESIVRESLQRLGRLTWDAPIQILAGPDRNYRMRAAFHVVDAKLGFIREKTNEVVRIAECSALVPELNAFISHANSQMELRGVHEVRAVSGTTIAASLDGRIVNLGPRPAIEVNSIRYQLNPNTFFQANRFLLPSFIGEVLRQAGPSPRHVLELYSGVGFFSLPLARAAQEVISVEEDDAAVREARDNARLNGVWNLKLFKRQVAATLQSKEVRPDVVVLDPPRTGFGARNAERVAEMKPARVVYVSCNPSTFAADAAALLRKGYKLNRVTLVDQFPNTFHIELVGQFERVL